MIDSQIVFFFTIDRCILQYSSMPDCWFSRFVPTIVWQISWYSPMPNCQISRFYPTIDRRTLRDFYRNGLKNFEIFLHDWLTNVLIFPPSEKLTKFVIFSRDQLTNFDIFCHDWLTNFAIFSSWPKDENFSATYCWIFGFFCSLLAKLMPPPLFFFATQLTDEFYNFFMCLTVEFPGFFPCDWSKNFIIFSHTWLLNFSFFSPEIDWFTLQFFSRDWLKNFAISSPRPNDKIYNGFSCHQLVNFWIFSHLLATCRFSFSCDQLANFWIFFSGLTGETREFFSQWPMNKFWDFFLVTDWWILRLHSIFPMTDWGNLWIFFFFYKD